MGLRSNFFNLEIQPGMEIWRYKVDVVRLVNGKRTLLNRGKDK